MKETNDVAATLVIKRLQAVPANIRFSIGGEGSFTASELINEVKQNSSVGKATIEMHLQFIKNMPHLLDRA